MRLIDADALKEEMKQRQESAYQWYSDAKVKEDEEIMVRADSAMTAFIECKLTIDKQPTADVVQERKGRWIPIQRGFFNKEVTQVKCDQCGHLLDLIGVNCGRGNANFCPNCGAHMDEVTE